MKFSVKIKFFQLLQLSEEAEKPADLSQKIVFKVKRKDKTEKDVTENPLPQLGPQPKESGKSKRKSQKPAKTLLSFNDDEDDDEG